MTHILVDKSELLQRIDNLYEMFEYVDNIVNNAYEKGYDVGYIDGFCDGDNKEWQNVR